MVLREEPGTVKRTDDVGVLNIDHYGLSLRLEMIFSGLMLNYMATFETLRD